MMHYVGEGQDTGLFENDPGLFTSGMGEGDLFGFDNLSQGNLDPLSEANIADKDRATKLLSQFASLSDTVNQIGNAQVKQGAIDLIKTQWYKVGTLSFLGLGGKYDLNQLAALVQQYANEMSFVRFKDPLRGDYSVTRSNENRLNSFAEGVQALANYLSQYVIIPPTTVDTGAASLLQLARGKAQLARASGAASDATVAKALAESARDAANAQSNASVSSEASQIMSDMDRIIAIGAGAAGKAIAATAGGTPDWVTYVAIGGGVAAVLGLAYMVTRK